MASRAARLWFCLVLACVATSTRARADDVAIAEKLFLEGKRLMDEGKDYPAACEKFKAAHDLDTTATGTLLNLALCHEQIKRNATAWAEFRQVVAESTGRREDRVTMARTHETKLAPLLSFIVVSVPAAARVAGLRVEIDKSRAIPEASWGVELPIDPGKHALDVTAPGKAPRTIEIVVGDAAHKQTATIPSLADAPTDTVPLGRPVEPSHTLAYVLGGVGVAALTVGTIFGAVALGKNGDADDAAARCPNRVCPDEATRSNAVSAVADANTFSNVANVGVGLGVALIVTGVVLYITAKPTRAASTRFPLTRTW